MLLFMNFFATHSGSHFLRTNILATSIGERLSFRYNKDRKTIKLNTVKDYAKIMKSHEYRRANLLRDYKYLLKIKLFSRLLL